jgi:tetratricopeptide (TPR) repeat protein
LYLFEIISRFIKRINKKKQKKTDHTNSIARTKGISIEELVKEREKEASRNNFEMTLNIFDKVIKKDPNYDIAYGDKALLLEKIGELDDSLELTLRALQTNQMNTITWHKRFDLYKEEKIL